MNINFSVPAGWRDLTDQQLRFVFRLIAGDYDADEIKILCLMKWSGTTLVARTDNGNYLLKMKKEMFEVSPASIAEILPHMEWLDNLPDFPVRISKIRGRKAVPADFVGVPFETFIICDNLYQGWLATHDDALVDEMAASLYGKALKVNPFERISIFYWFASLKDWLARKYSDFFNPAGADRDNLLGAPAVNVEEAMNAQIRALTKGDVTKESEVLALDTHRALTELNAQAREYREFNRKYNKP